LAASAVAVVVAVVVVVTTSAQSSSATLVFSFAPAGTRAPLILDLHGAGQTPEMQRVGSGMFYCTRQRRWHVAYPSGVGRTWNAGPGTYAPASGSAALPATDHVGNLSSMAVSLRASLNASHVFVAGLSNGCAMALRLGLEAEPGVIDGVACTGHAMNADIRAREPPEPRPLLLLTGAHDPMFAGDAAIARTLEEWMFNNGCNGTLRSSSVTSDLTTSDANACGANAVRHVLFHHHGHIVPQHRAAEMQCAFFERFL